MHRQQWRLGSQDASPKPDAGHEISGCGIKKIRPTPYKLERCAFCSSNSASRAMCPDLTQVIVRCFESPIRALRLRWWSAHTLEYTHHPASIGRRVCRAWLARATARQVDAGQRMGWSAAVGIGAKPLLARTLPCIDCIHDGFVSILSVPARRRDSASSHDRACRMGS